MRFRISRELNQIRTQPENEFLRKMISFLRRDLRPGWAEKLSEGTYSFIHDQYTIIYRIEENGETVIYLMLEEK